MEIRVATLLLSVSISVLSGAEPIAVGTSRNINEPQAGGARSTAAFGLRMLEPSPLLPPPSAGPRKSLTPRFSSLPMLLPPPPEAEAVSRSRSSRPGGNPDVDLTSEPRRWQTVASSAGMQPYTWGSSDGANARVALGIQSALFYTDNVDFQTDNLAKGETIFELSPIINVDIGDPQSWISGTSNKLSEYYVSLLYVPTFYYRLRDDTDDYAQHLLGEIGRINQVSRSVLRLDYDERIQASSDNTSPEENYTLLTATALMEYRLSPRTSIRGKAGHRQITVAQGGSSRGEWIGDAALLWDYSPKTRIGFGTEGAHISFKQRPLGTQDYAQALLLMEWKPSPKMGFTTRTGFEWRQFNRAPPRSDRTSLVTLTTFYWQITEKTRINARFGLANRPSVIAQGALYRELRFGPQLLHDFTAHYYGSAEAQVVRRRYDTGRLDWEPQARLAFGYRQDPDKGFNRTNVEAFLQWHRRERSDLSNANVERTQIGMQLTCFF